MRSFTMPQIIFRVMPPRQRVMHQHRFEARTREPIFHARSHFAQIQRSPRTFRRGFKIRSNRRRSMLVLARYAERSPAHTTKHRIRIRNLAIAPSNSRAR